MAEGIAIVVGVGAEAGLGAACCRRFAREGLEVLAAGRTPSRLDAVAASIEKAGGRARGIVTDATNEEDVARLFDAAGEAPALVVYNAGNAVLGDALSMEARAFEDTWRVSCLGGFLVGREAARRMAPLGRGTLLFTGATASLRARPPFLAFASAKFGLRAVAQAMARELGPRGLHVAHVVVDGGIAGDQLLRRVPALAERAGEDGLLDPDAIANAYWHLHTQHRSAWTHELDLRPFKESF